MSSVEGPIIMKQDGDFKLTDCRRFLYWQGFWKDENPEPNLEFYLKYFSPRLAHLLVKHRFLRTALRLFRRFNPRFIIISLFVHVFYFLPKAIYLYKSNSAYIIGNVCAFIIYGIMLTAACTAFFQLDLLRIICEKLDGMLVPGQLDNQEQKEIYYKTCTFYRIIKKIHIPFAVAASITLTLDFFGRLFPARQFPTKEWFPWDTSSSPSYEITLFIRWLQTMSCCTFVSSLTWLMILAIVMPTTIFKILNNKLEKIHATSIERIKARKLKESSGLAPDTILSIDFDDGDLFHMRGDLLGAAPAALNAGIVICMAHMRPLFEAGHLGSTSGRERTASEEMFQDSNGIPENQLKVITTELDEEMHNVLTECIQLHVKLIRYIALSEEFGNASMVGLLVANTLSLGMATLTLFTDNETPKTVVLITLFFFAWITMLYFVANNSTQLVTDQHDAVCESVYRCDWLEASPSFKKSMLVIMSRANVPLEVKPPGCDPLSRKNFAQVMNMAYKMVSTLTETIK